MKALITGATRGIGEAISKELASRAYDLLIIARNESDLQRLAADLVDLGAGQVEYIAADLSSTSDRSDVLNSLSGDFDVLVNNLGVYDMTPVNQITSGLMHKQFCTNFYPAIDITQKLVPSLIERKGNIIFISSVAAENLVDDAAAYSLSKAVLKDYIELLRRNIKSQGVKVSEIIPGPVNTSSWDDVEAPKDEFIQTEDIVAVLRTIISSDKRISIDKININSIKH